VILIFDVYYSEGGNLKKVNPFIQNLIIILEVAENVFAILVILHLNCDKSQPLIEEGYNP